MEASADPAIVRHATVRWVGSPPSGVARAHVDSRAFTSLPVGHSPGSPTTGMTTPGELLAAAYAAFLAVRLARQLDADGHAARELVVSASCLIGDWVTGTVAGFKVDVHGVVPGMDEEQFHDVVHSVTGACGEALGLRDDMPVDLHTSLADRERSTAHTTRSNGASSSSPRR